MPLWASYGIIVYGRFTPSEAALVMVNCSDQEAHIRPRVWRLGVPRDAEIELSFFTNPVGYQLNEDGITKRLLSSDAPEDLQIRAPRRRIPLKSGKAEIELPARSGAVYLWRGGQA